MPLTLEELAKRIGAELRGDGALPIHGCATLDEAGPTDLSFLANRKYARQLQASRAGAVVLTPADAEQAGERPMLVTDDPYFAFRNAVVALIGFREHPAPGISDKAVVADSATLGKDCHVSPFAVIAEGAKLGARCVIYPGCYIGRDVVLGDDCVLHPNVTIYERCTLGNRVVLHAGCSIGHDGFGYATHQGAHHKIPHIGTAIIEDDVEMGAACTVDRATLGTTRVGAGTKCSNSVTIGHGCTVGRHNLLVAQVGLAGSTKTGDYVVMGGQAGAAGHLEIGDGAQFAAQSGIGKSMPGGQQYGGAPAVPLAQIKRQWMAVQRLPDLLTTVRQLQKRIDQLETRLSETEHGQPH
ncbi:MAG: UDP-3-O-(3-hydroxymyristoyl)glucosamine N-acyltransferase [Phycisphaeraceae bacterium]